MDEDTLRRRVDCWRRRAAESSDPRDRAARSELAGYYEALLAHLLDSRSRPADGPQGGRSPPDGDSRR